MSTRQTMTVARPQSSEERLCWAGFWGNLALSVSKIAAGLLANSVLVFADGLHSAANAIMSAGILVGMRTARRPSDRGHPYGHGKSVFLVAALGAIVVASGAMWLLLSSVRVVGKPLGFHPHWIVLAVAALSIVANEFLQKRLSIGGHALQDMAGNNRANTCSSIVVLVCTLLAMLGLPFVVRIGSIAVATIVLVASLRVLRRSLDLLMDQSLPEHLVQRIREIAQTIDGVREVSALKTRAVGYRLWIDMEIRLEPERTISEAGDIEDRIKSLLLRRLDDVESVSVEFRPVGA